jgi:hypothetical protein
VRIEIPPAHQANPAAFVGQTYAKDIVASAFQFSAMTYERSKLSLREFEGARARTAEINGCLICQGWRSARDVPGYLTHFGADPSRSIATRGPAPDEAFYMNVSKWRESPVYSPRERIAIEYAERIGLEPKGIAKDDAFWTRAKAVFSDDEIVDLTFCVACWIGLGRAVHVLGLDGACAFNKAA